MTVKKHVFKVKIWNFGGTQNAGRKKISARRCILGQTKLIWNKTTYDAKKMTYDGPKTVYLDRKCHFS